MIPAIGPGNGVLPRARLSLAADTTLAFAGVDTYEKIAGTWTGASLVFFEATAAGRLTFKGPDGTAFLFAGSSDVEVDKVGLLTYALHRNGALEAGTETPADIEASGRIRNISITSIIELDADDYIEVFAKYSDGTATLTAKNLAITLWGDHR